VPAASSPDLAIRVQLSTLDGDPETRPLTGGIARLALHEIDHLYGMLDSRPMSREVLRGGWRAYDPRWRRAQLNAVLGVVVVGRQRRGGISGPGSSHRRSAGGHGNEGRTLGIPQVGVVYWTTCRV